MGLLTFFDSVILGKVITPLTMNSSFSHELIVNNIIKINNPNKPEEALLNIAPFETEVYTVNDSES